MDIPNSFRVFVSSPLVAAHLTASRRHFIPPASLAAVPTAQSIVPASCYAWAGSGRPVLKDSTWSGHRRHKVARNVLGITNRPQVGRDLTFLCEPLLHWLALRRGRCSEQVAQNRERVSVAVDRDGCNR